MQLYIIKYNILLSSLRQDKNEFFVMEKKKHLDKAGQVG